MEEADDGEKEEGKVVVVLVACLHHVAFSRAYHG